MKKPEPPKPSGNGKHPAKAVSVEVLPPVSAQDLSNIEEQIREIRHTLNEKERAFFNEAVYDVVGLGLYLLKAEAIHLLRAQPETVSGKRRNRNDRGELQAGEGFTAWLAEAFPDLHERTARNYRNAARNAGLTSDHTLADVEKLRAQKVLHEKRPTDLYKLADATPAGGDNSPPEPPPNLVAEVAHTRRAALDQTLSLRDTMSDEEYEAAWSELKDTLEKLTGACWHMAETEDIAEHGAQRRAMAKTHGARWKAAPKNKKGKGK